MARRGVSRRVIIVILAAVATGCGGQTTGTREHDDVAAGSTGGVLGDASIGPSASAGTSGSDGVGGTPSGGTFGTQETACRAWTGPSCENGGFLPNGGFFCATTWAVAQASYGCDTGPADRHLAQCGRYHALMGSHGGEGYISSDFFYYDDGGRLIGYEQWLGNFEWCDSFDPSFVPPAPNTCVPLAEKCPVDASSDASATITCGSQTCSTNQFCVQQFLGGPNLCVRVPDAGTCPPGWDYDPSCPSSPRGAGCDPPPPSPPPPYCADIPKSCFPLPTTPVAASPCADSVCRAGVVVQIAGRNVTCATQ